MRRAAGFVAAVVLTAAAGLVLPAAPAAAAVCGSADGVTVVVDFHELGGGVRSVCDADGGGQAASRLFPDNGFPLTYVQRQPGFVCRVQGLPSAEEEACVNTPPADAYWGLWWSDGESGTWTYSSEGVAALNVPEGGAVAFSWNGSATKSPPGVAAPTHEEQSSPAPQPTQQPGQPNGTGSAGDGPSGTPAPTSSSSATPGAAPSPTGTAKPGRPGKGDGRPAKGKGGDRDRPDPEADEATDAPEEPAGTSTAEPPADPGDGGLPTWVAPAGIAGLFGIAGVVALLRRRSAVR